MNGFTIVNAAQSCCGQISSDSFENVQLGRVVIDSRQVRPGDIFVAYKGEKVDGHDYISAAFEKGAACCLAQRIPEGETRPIIVVPDVQDALEGIAAGYRRLIDIPVIGITGSVGKTSAKEMVAAVLSRKYNVLKTEGNLNNQIGVPMTLSRISPQHEAAVVEMGISDFGEMSRLAQMARPTIAIFTVIGHAHLEFLHDLQGVLEAKSEMLDYMSEDAPVIVNGDDELLKNLRCRQKKTLFGLSEHCDVRAVDIELDDAGHTCCTIIARNRSIRVCIPAYGQHMVYAALAGAATGIALGLSDQQIAEGIAQYETVGRRGVVTDTGYITLVDDCYNANPDSVRCGVDSLVKLPGRHVCVLGDMLELGEQGGHMHFEVGRYAVENGIELVLSCGSLGAEISRGAGQRGRHFESLAELIESLLGIIEEGDKVLVKASRSMHFEEIAEALKKL